MTIDRRGLLGAGVGVGLLAATGAAAQQWGDPPTPSENDPEAPAWPPMERFALWPKGPPNASAKLPSPAPTMNGPRGERQLWVRGVAVPEVHVYRPARPDGSAMLAIPGGGYGFLSVQNEGIDVAQRFNASGTTIFVLTYRLPGEGWTNRHQVPLQDAQRAMRMIRARAADFRVDPLRLGIVGFSAGGHLAADLATSHDEPVYQRTDADDAQSAKPAFAALIYPVTSLDPAISHGGSRANLLGPDPSSALIGARSPVLHVRPQTPPCFVVHSFDDSTVPIANSLQWIAACQAAKVPVEAHLFGEGGHGYGLHLPDTMPGSRWPGLLDTWLRKHGG